MTLHKKTSFSESIYQNMKLKETDELLEIWFENDRLEWSDDAFGVIHSILLERLGDVPPQAASNPKKRRKNSTSEKVKLPIPIIVMISAFLTIFVLLGLVNQTNSNNQWFSVLFLSLFAIFFFAPGFYFTWLSWIKSTETQQKIFRNFRKAQGSRGVLFRLSTLFLPDPYIPAYFLWTMRIMAFVLIYGGIKMILFIVKLF